MHNSRRGSLAFLALVLAPIGAFAVDIGDLHCNDANGVSNNTNQVVTVRGIVTNNAPTGSNNRIYIQDATGGINVFGTPQNCALALGDDVEVNGTVIQFNGLTEVSSTMTLPLTLTIHSSGNALPAPLVQTIAQCNAAFQGDNCEPNESRLVKVTGLIRTSTGAVPASGATFAGNTNYRLTSTGADSTTNFLVLRVVSSTNACNVVNGLVGVTIPRGCAADVTGVLSQFDSSSPFTSGWQLLPDGAGTVVCSTVPVRETAWSRVKRLYR
jgi:hypothetical protein